MPTRRPSFLLLLAWIVPPTFGQSPDSGATSKTGKDAPAPGGKMIVTRDETALEGERRVAFPSPYARMLGIETALKKSGVAIDWNGLYKRWARADLKPDRIPKDKAASGFAIGVRLADGVIAFMGKDTAKLKQCARDVNTLAQRLGVKRDDLGSVAPLTRAVEEENWTEIYWHMGVLQQEIVTSLDTDKDRSMTAIVASGAWLQGLRYATDLILANQNRVDLSNMLRAAPIAELLGAELRKTPADVRSLPPVVSGIAALNAVQPLIDVRRDELIPAAKVKQIQDFAGEAINAAVP